MYAIIKTGGKQYRVTEGDVINVEKIEAEGPVTFEPLLIGDGEDTEIGKPTVAGASVQAEIVQSGKGEKVIIYKYKAKKDYRKKQGHRQPYTTLKITAISKA